MLDENGHDWEKPALRQRMVGNYLEVCVQCGVERVGPQSREECSGDPPPGRRHRTS